MGDDKGPHDMWEYVAPEDRVNRDFSSANTGDILLLANMRNGYQFGVPYRSQHGSLTRADASVPVAFGHLGAAGNGSPNDLLGPIRSLFAEYPDGTTTPLETKAILKFFDR